MSVIEQAQRARVAAARLAVASRTEKDAALRALADALEARTAEVLAANAEDVARAESGGTPPNVVDRLRLTPDRLAGMAQIQAMAAPSTRALPATSPQKPASSHTATDLSCTP